MRDYTHLLAWLAQTGKEGAQSQQTPSQTPPMQNFILMMVLIAAAFYFIILRPQSKEKKERQRQMDSLAKGDTIVTIGGLHGEVTKVAKDGKTVEVEVSKNVRLTFNKSAVATIVRRGKGGGEPEAKEQSQ